MCNRADKERVNQSFVKFSNILTVTAFLEYTEFLRCYCRYIRVLSCQGDLKSEVFQMVISKISMH